MTITCDICGGPAVKHQQLRADLNTGRMGDVAFLAVASWPRKTHLCYFCVRETLLQLLKQSEKLQDVTASVNLNPQDPLCPANPTS